MKELGDYYYKIHNRKDQDSEENPFEKEERVRCQEEEEERGYFRQTVAQMIKERSAAKKKKKEMEEKMKEVEKKDHIKSKKDKKEEYVEVDKPEENHSPEGEGDDGTQDATRGAPDPTESFHPQEDCCTSVQEASRQHLTLKELDKESEAETGQAVQSSKVVDEEAEEGSTK